MILLGAGRQSTELFLSHHPQKIIDKMEVSLDRFLIGKVADEPHKRFSSSICNTFTLRIASIPCRMEWFMKTGQPHK